MDRTLFGLVMLCLLLLATGAPVTLLSLAGVTALTGMTVWVSWKVVSSVQPRPQTQRVWNR